MHTDFNWNPKLRLDRRINPLLYLNCNWDEAWSGELELADDDGGLTAKIAPVGNRHCTAIPSLRFPDDYPRASVAIY